MAAKVRYIMLYVLLSAIPLIDMLNGAILIYNISSIPVSLLYKAAIMSVAMVIILLYMKDSAKFVLTFISLCVMWLSLSIIFEREIKFQDIIWLNRVFFVFILLLFFRFVEPIRRQRIVIGIAKWWFIFFVINQVIGAIGFGHMTYSKGLGISGLYFAPNELAPVLALSFAVYYFNRHKSLTLNQKLLFLIMYGFAAWSLATRFSIAMLFINISFAVISPIYIRIRKRHTKYMTDIIMIGVTLIGGISILRISWFNILSTGVVQSWINGLSNHESVISFLLSSRNFYLMQAAEQFVKRFPEVLIVGGRTPLVEMGLFDIPFRYGLILPVLIGLLFLVCIRCARKELSKKAIPPNRVPNIVIVAVIVYGLFWGHVFLSSTVLLLLVLVAMSKYKSTTKRNTFNNLKLLIK